MTQDDVEKRMAALSPTLDLSALADCDLIIEAVFENMAIKKELFGKLDKIAKPGAILASNTCYLNVDEIASATSRPQDVIGMHFFSPANVMKLLEMVRGAKTSPMCWPRRWISARPSARWRWCRACAMASSATACWRSARRRRRR